MRKLLFLFTLVIAAAGFTSAQDVVFRANAPEAVVMGKQFRISYTINAEGKELRAPDFKDFRVLAGPSTSTSHSSVIVNNRMQSETTITYTYVLMPTQEGTFTIPAATIRANNSNYTSNSLTIKVLPPDQEESSQSSSNNDAYGLGDNETFMRMIVSKTSVYEQEGFLVTFKYYTRVNAGLDDFKFPEFEGFLAQEVELPQDKDWLMENYNGQNYRTVVLKQTILYPQRTGKITIDEGRFLASIRVRVNQSRGSIFDDFFDNMRTVHKELKTRPVTIDVKPLPSGKPAGFSGGVGDFTMETSISSNNVKANEAVTVKVKIIGNGNIRLVKNPEVAFPNDFEVYDPNVKIDTRTNTLGTNGVKNIEYMAIPRFAGDFEIPPVTFSYFDLKTNSYKTLSSGPMQLHVERGEGGSETAPVVSNNYTNKENVRYLGQDIRFLKTKGFNFHTRDELLYGSFLYWMCYLIPAILFIIFFIVYRKQVKENADIALVRTKKANKMAVKRLKIAGKLLKENKKEEFYEEVLRALWGYLSDKLNIPQANLTKDNVESELVKYGVDESLINEFMDILNTCEFARYAPAQGSDAMDKLYALTVDAIGKMESTIKK